MKDIFKQALNRVAADNDISSKLDRPTEFQAFAREIVECLIKPASLPDPFTKLVKRNAEIAVMNKSKLHDQNENVGRNEKVTPPSPRAERSPASLNPFKHEKQKKSEKKKKASHSSKTS